MTRARHRRAGFTLIELLVVIALIVVLTGLVFALLSSGVVDSKRVVQSADTTAQWLLTARNRAARDKAPRGVRFIRSTDPVAYADTPDAANPGFFVSEAQYIDGTGGVGFIPNPTGNPNGAILHVVRPVIDGTNPWATTRGDKIQLLVLVPIGTAATFLTDNGVDQGHLLICPDLPRAVRLAAAPGAMQSLPANLSAFNTTHQGVIPLTISNTDQAALALAFGSGYTRSSAGTNPSPAAQASNTFATLNFAFQPQPLPLFGEPLLQLGSEAVIDARYVGDLTSTLDMVNPVDDSKGLGYFDIIFGPSGEVLVPSPRLLALWVRNPKKGTGPYDFADAGEQVLVGVTGRTGLVATHPVNPDAANPYRFLRDGVNAGF